jgi:hypothetical protein
MELIEWSELSDGQRLTFGRNYCKRRLDPADEVRGSVVLANFGDGIGHNTSPRKNRLLEYVDDGRADLVAVWRYVFDGADAPPARSGLFASPRSNFAIKAAKASGCSFVVR